MILIHLVKYKNKRLAVKCTEKITSAAGRAVSKWPQTAADADAGRHGHSWPGSVIGLNALI